MKTLRFAPLLLLAVPCAHAQEIPSVVQDAALQPGGKKDATRHRTFNARDWGRKCTKVNDAACQRDRDFAAWFPRGLVVGDQGGHDRDAAFALIVRDAEQARVLLSAEPKAGGTLTADGLGDQRHAGGRLARQLVAAKLNLALDRARPGERVSLGALVFNRKAARPLRGRTVTDVIDMGDRALSGELGTVAPKDSGRQGLIDLDGDGRKEVTLAGLAEALLAFNVGFQWGAGREPVVHVRKDRPTAGVGDPAAGDEGGTEGPAIGKPRPDREGDRRPEREGTPPRPEERPGPADRSPVTSGTPCTYTQGGWGQKCSGGNVGCLRDEHFARLFPRGLILGDPDGLDADAQFAVVFQSARDVAAFLPAGGRPGSLDRDLLNPTSSTAGVFLGQLLAAKLNVIYDDRGLTAGGARGLGRAVFVDCVAAPLRGVEMKLLVRLGERALCGEFGPLLDPPAHSKRNIDVDGDGRPDVSLTELSEALDRLNNGFRNCRPSGSCIGLPSDAPTGGPHDVGAVSPELGKAAEERDRELEKIEDEYQRELQKVRAEAEREGKPEKAREKARELTKKYEEKKAKILRKYEEKAREQEKRGRGEGRGRGDDDD